MAEHREGHSFCQGKDLPWCDRQGADSSDNIPTGPQQGGWELLQNSPSLLGSALLGSEEGKHGCSQPGPKGHTRPSGCTAWAGGSQPQLPAQELSPGPHWPGCKGEAKEELVLSAQLLPSEEQENPQGITLGRQRGPRDAQGL